MDAIWHAILDNFRPISVWGVDLIIFYALIGSTTTQYGEPWTEWSYLQLIGMLLLFLGTAIYNETILCTCCIPCVSLPPSPSYWPLSLSSSFTFKKVPKGLEIYCHLFIIFYISCHLFMFIKSIYN